MKNLTRRMSLMFSVVAVLGLMLSSTAMAGETISVMKLEVTGEAPQTMVDALINAIKSEIRGSEHTLGPKGGDITFQDVQLVTECEEETPECLDVVCKFLETDNIIYGALDVSGASYLKWYTKGVGFHREVDGMASNKDEAAKLARRLITGETGILRVGSGENVGAEVLIDGTPAGLTPFEGELPLGSHSVQARKAGYFDSQVRTVTLAKSAPTELTFELELDPDQQIESEMSTSTLIGWIATGVGGACLIGGGATGIMVGFKQNELDDAVKAAQTGPEANRAKEYDKAKAAKSDGATLETTEFALFGAGGGLFAVGLALVIWSYMDEESSPSADLDFDFIVTPDGGAAAVGFSF
ncbi:MAG: hypothetical protein CO108_08175 [Deltaproteobacteria bacterium CG_4_9_14_3_um_filter_63_12]|nr:MAG: hypothetical protein CO108_08175 [Deltaproteobacteria bacterium CG_4_9_14_3_um_filter_63_12]